MLRKVIAPTLCWVLSTPGCGGDDYVPQAVRNPVGRQAPKAGQKKAEEVNKAEAPAEEPAHKEMTPEEWWADRLKAAPSPPDGMSLADAEKLHRYLDVMRFNSAGDQGMRFGTDYEKAAEALQIHVDVLKAADSYVHYERMKFMAELVRELLKADAELEPNYYHPIRESAFFGNYTVIAEIVLSACKGDDDLEKKAADAARRLDGLVAPVADGFKITRVKYVCERLGTEGNLEMGFLGSKGDIRQMPKCPGTYATKPSKDTRVWCMRAWSDGQVVEG